MRNALRRGPLAIAAAAAAVLLLGAPAASAKARVAFIETARLEREIPSMKAAAEKLEKVVSKSKALHDKKTKELEGRFEALRKKKDTLTDKDKEELKKIDFEYMTLLKNLNEELAKERAKVLGPIENRIKKIISLIGEKHGYALILDKTAIIWAPPHLDVTNDVIRMWEDGVAKDAAVAPKPPKAPKAPAGPKLPFAPKGSK